MRRNLSRVPAIVVPVVLLALAVGVVPGLPWSALHQTGAALAGSATGVLTQHNDNARTGANLGESTLTTSNVNAASFGKLFTRAVDGQLYAQPLYVPNLTINGGTHDVVFLATMHNTVYAFDADDPAQSSPLWSVNLGPSIPLPDPCFGSSYGGYQDIEVEVGIVSTPALDSASNTL